MPRSTETVVAVLQAPLACARASPHARGLRCRGGYPRVFLSLALLGRSWSAGGGFALPAAVVAALYVEAAALSAAAVVAVVVALAFAAAVVDAVGVAAAALGRVGADSPCDSASSRRRVLIMPSRDAMWRWSKAIIACSAVEGGGGVPCTPWKGRRCEPPPCRRLRAVHPREKQPAPRLWP